MEASASPALTTHALTTGYAARGRPARVVSTALDLTLSAGELVCLIGPNGAGKSTLMRTLAGLQAPISGRVLLRGQDVTTLSPAQIAAQISLVLTERPPLGIMTVYELVALGRLPHTDWSGRLTADDEAAVRWALAAVGGEALSGRQVDELSDGERQKVMIARALAQGHTLMLLDEPTAFLDLPRRVEVMRLLRRLSREAGCAVLISTHDLELALRSADRLWLMAAGGQLHHGTPEDLILTGTFGAVFGAEGVEFDVQTGAFKLHTAQAAPVGLLNTAADPLIAFWTRRALERAGYAVRPEVALPYSVRLCPAAGERWQVITPGGATSCPDLAAVLAVLTSFSPKYTFT